MHAALSRSINLSDILSATTAISVVTSCLVLMRTNLESVSYKNKTSQHKTSDRSALTIATNNAFTDVLFLYFTVSQLISSQVTYKILSREVL